MVYAKLVPRHLTVNTKNNVFMVFIQSSARNCYRRQEIPPLQSPSRNALIWNGYTRFLPQNKNPMSKLELEKPLLLFFSTVKVSFMA